MEKIFSLASQWELAKEKIKEANPNITDSDLELQPGREEDLYERLAKKLNKSKAETKDWIKSVAANSSIAG